MVVISSTECFATTCALNAEFPDVFGKRPIGLSATKAQTVVIRFGKFYRNGLGEFAEAACSRSPFGFDFIAITHLLGLL